MSDTQKKDPKHNDHHHNDEHCDEGIHIFVNKRHYGKKCGVKKKMSVEEIAKLVGWSHQQVKVRFSCPRSEETSEPLSGEIEIVNGDHFVVTRCNVVGGHLERIQAEISELKEAGQEVKFLTAPYPCLIYKKVVSPGGTLLKHTDVLVPVPNGYPAAMIDRLAVPEGSPLIGKLKGAPQEIIMVEGIQWRLISYHPHTNGGAGPWQPGIHGFHTYFGEILSWLGDI